MFGILFSNFDIKDLSKEQIKDADFLKSKFKFELKEKYNSLSKEMKEFIDEESMNENLISEIQNDYISNIAINSKNKKNIIDIFIYINNIKDMEELKSFENSYGFNTKLSDLSRMIKKVDQNDIINIRKKYDELKSIGDKEKYFREIVEEYYNFSYTKKIKINVLIGRLLRHSDINNDIKNLIFKLEPKYEVLEIENISSYYSIFTRILNLKTIENELFKKFENIQEPFMKNIIGINLLKSNLNKDLKENIKQELQKNYKKIEFNPYKYVVDKEEMEMLKEITLELILKEKQ